jgi:hypothetical protein
MNKYELIYKLSYNLIVFVILVFGFLLIINKITIKSGKLEVNLSKWKIIFSNGTIGGLMIVASIVLAIFFNYKGYSSEVTTEILDSINVKKTPLSDSVLPSSSSFSDSSSIRRTFKTEKKVLKIYPVKNGKMIDTPIIFNYPNIDEMMRRTTGSDTNIVVFPSKQ